VNRARHDAEDQLAACRRERDEARAQLKRISEVAARTVHFERPPGNSPWQPLLSAILSRAQSAPSAPVDPEIVRDFAAGTAAAEALIEQLAPKPMAPDEAERIYREAHVETAERRKAYGACVYGYADYDLSVYELEIL
jgi:hypothetical protein